MRCPDCCKFVSFDEPEAEVDNVEVSAYAGDTPGECSLTITGDVVIRLNCSECSTTLKETNTSFEHSLVHACASDDLLPDFDVDCDDPETFDRYETKDRHGKPIKSFRYQRHYYGATIGFRVTCSACEQEEVGEETMEEQASSFDEVA